MGPADKGHHLGTVVGGKVLVRQSMVDVSAKFKKGSLGILTSNVLVDSPTDDVIPWLQISFD